MRLHLLIFLIGSMHCSCPPGFELVRAGECRGLHSQITKHVEEPDYVAAFRCGQIQGKPVIIHDEEHQNYWRSIQNDTHPYTGILLGLTCTEPDDQRGEIWQWADGSPIDYTPPGFTSDMEAYECGFDYAWYIQPNGFWENEEDTYPIDVYCTTQLEQPVGDGCDNFYDDKDDGVCYQIGAAASNWQEAQTTCRNIGSDVASIHNIQENNFVRRLAVSNGAVNGLFLGATVSGKGKGFGWMDGSEWDYDNFYPGFPMDGLGECLTMDTLSTSGQWVNVNCNSSFPVACAKPRDPVAACTSGPWQAGQIIYSPGYPYDASVPCNYVLAVDAGMRVEVHVKLLEANTCCDHLILTDNYIGGNTIANLTGEITDQTFTSDSNIMRVTWQPNGGVNVRGMMFIYYAVAQNTPTPPN